MQSIFEQFLEIKTWKKDFLTKAVYVPNSISKSKWTYFVYFYDIFTHTFYINDLNNLQDTSRKSAIDIIDNIMNRAYRQEMNSLMPVLQKIQMNKEPKVLCIYLEKETNLIIIDKINMKVVRWLDWLIKWFKNPKRKRYWSKEI